MQPPVTESASRGRVVNVGWGVALLLLIPAAIFISAGAVGVANGLKSSATAAGTITSVGKDCHGTYPDARGVVRTFTHYGDKSTCANKYRVGQEVTVHYDPARPAVADTTSPTYTAVVHALLAAAGLALAAPLALIAAAMIRRKRAHY